MKNLLSRTIAVFLIGFTVSIVASVGHPNHAVSQTGYLIGIVADSDEAPIKGATVRLLGTQKGATTDQYGAYNVKKVIVGETTVIYSAIGYDTVMVKVKIDTGANWLDRAVLRKKVEP